MPRVATEDFEDEEVARVYLAARFAEAQLVEAELNKHDVDYAVEVEAYLPCAVFYVPAAQADFCRGILLAAGLRAGLLEKDFQ